MGKNKQKSAKDLAFERERVRLQSAIRQKDEEIAALNAEITKHKAAAESWEKTARFLEGYIGIPKEKLIADIENNERIASFLKPLTAVGRYLYK